MGARFCILCHPISDQKSKSLGPRDGRSRDGTRTSFKEFIKLKCLKVENRKGKKAMEAPEKKSVTLEDFIKASPGFKQSKKKVSPCSSQSQPRRSSICDAKDSLYLDRPMNHHSEEASYCSSITRSLSGMSQSQKRVSFKLPHDVIFYSPHPDEPYSKEASLGSSSQETNSSEDAFSSPNRPGVRLAVDTLPHVFVSSRI